MSPYLSIVVASRNDVYGGDFLGRMQRFVKVFFGFLSDYPFEAELIVVEWNPPNDRPSLLEAIRWPNLPQNVGVRLVEVPHEIHRQVPNCDKIALYEYLAKNVGVRRAKGQFILVTNPDVLVSKALFSYLALRRLDHRFFYRMDRYDFRGSPPSDAGPEDIFDYAIQRIFQANVRIGNRTDGRMRVGSLRRLYARYSGNWQGSYRWFEISATREPVVCLEYNNNGAYGGIHTNASGDFLLASSESWKGIRGFPEFFDTFTHLDSYACHQFKALGLGQALLVPPCMLLHEEHSREEHLRRPVRSNSKWEDDLRAIRNGRLGPALNGHAWGLAGETLGEIVLNGPVGSK